MGAKRHKKCSFKKEAEGGLTHRQKRRRQFDPRCRDWALDHRWGGISKEDSEGIATEQKNQGRSYAVGISQRNE